MSSTVLRLIHSGSFWFSMELKLTPYFILERTPLPQASPKQEVISSEIKSVSKEKRKISDCFNVTVKKKKPKSGSRMRITSILMKVK